mmetsp:Transcript_125524/g.390748  ORF Transcript_125524/g.390748 Transcript_125524/m.390748 type:complete len:214 (-) Transcript_125524:3659-4300(-)
MAPRLSPCRGWPRSAYLRSRTAGCPYGRSGALANPRQTRATGRARWPRSRATAACLAPGKRRRRGPAAAAPRPCPARSQTGRDGPCAAPAAGRASTRGCGRCSLQRQTMERPAAVPRSRRSLAGLLFRARPRTAPWTTGVTGPCATPPSIRSATVPVRFSSLPSAWVARATRASARRRAAPLSSPWTALSRPGRTGRPATSPATVARLTVRAS